MDKVRVDKWLWSVRIFKSRTIASAACKGGRVKIDGAKLKPSYMLQVGEILQVNKEGFNMTFKVVKLIEKRVGAPIAQTCYENLTPAEEMNKFKDWFTNNAPVEKRERGTGRPTKRDRRAMDKFKRK